VSTTTNEVGTATWLPISGLVQAVCFRYFGGGESGFSG
jgi:hypothetical protein